MVAVPAEAAVGTPMARTPPMLTTAAPAEAARVELQEEPAPTVRRARRPSSITTDDADGSSDGQRAGTRECADHGAHTGSSATSTLASSPRCRHPARYDARTEGDSAAPRARATSFAGSANRDKNTHLPGNVVFPTTSVEVKGLEPSASTLRTYGSQPFDQVLSEDFPGGSVWITSGSLTLPLLPSR